MVAGLTVVTGLALLEDALNLTVLDVPVKLVEIAELAPLAAVGVSVDEVVGGLIVVDATATLVVEVLATEIVGETVDIDICGDPLGTVGTVGTAGPATDPSCPLSNGAVDSAEGVGPAVLCVGAIPDAFDEANVSTAEVSPGSTLAEGVRAPTAT